MCIRDRVPDHGLEREAQELEPVRACRPQAAVVQVALRLEVALERAGRVAEVLGRPLPQLGLAPASNGLSCCRVDGVDPTID